MNIVSLQSAVAYGHVGNSAAVFPMQRLGNEVWPVYTVNFSNHTEYPTWRGPVMTPEQVADVLDGMSFAFGEVDLFVSGYLGSAELAEVVYDAVQRIKRANPSARYICDPVIGNAQIGSFVAPEIPGVFRDHLIPLADAVTPNQWELALLTGADLGGEGAGPQGESAAGAEDATVLTARTVEAARSLKDTALITSASGSTADTLRLIEVTPEKAMYVETPRLGGNVVGAGDLATAMYAALQGEAVQDRLAHLAGTMFDIVSEVRGRGLAELPLVECQDLIVAPRSRFVPAEL